METRAPAVHVSKGTVPLAMDPALVKAHDKLGAAVDKAFGASRKRTSENQRLEVPFARYTELTS